MQAVYAKPSRNIDIGLWRIDAVKSLRIINTLLVNMVLAKKAPSPPHGPFFERSGRIDENVRLGES
jgi:hypothetical protein